MMIMIPAAILAIESDVDREFMSRLYEDHYRLMYKVVWEYTNVREDVEDIVSDSVVALIGKVSKLQSMNCNEIRHYIVSTVRNVAINHWKSNKRRESQLELVEKEKMESIPWTEGGTGSISFFEEIEAVRSAYYELTEKEQIITRLKFLEDKSDLEIANQTGIAENSVRKYIQRARNKIRDSVYRNEASSNE